jgi:hypothetical protein
MILLGICAAWAAEPKARRSETRLSAMAVVRTESRTVTGEGLDLSVTHQFPTPIVLGVELAAGVDHGVEYEFHSGVGDDLYVPEPVHDPEFTGFGLWGFAGYTVRVNRVDVTPVLRVSLETGYFDVSGTVRWWTGDHWSLQTQIGPYQLANLADKGLFDLGLGVAWRPRAPHREK